MTELPARSPPSVLVLILETDSREALRLMTVEAQSGRSVSENRVNGASRVSTVRKSSDSSVVRSSTFFSVFF